MAVLCRQSASVAARFFTRRIDTRTSVRSFGATAAAIEIAYDSEWEDEQFSHRSPPMPPLAASAKWGEIKERGVQWVFMGSPGAQKRDCATRVAQLLEVPYISMGTLVRQELHPHSSLYIKIANAVNEGKLVPEDIIFGLLSKRLEEDYYKGETGFILDGIPKTRIQAEILDQIADIDLVVNFKCAEDCLAKKHFGSDLCAYCGKIYDIFNTQSTRLNACLVTRTCHSKLNTSATFDMDKSRLERLQLYSEQNKLLEDYYKKKNKLLDFHIAEGPGETWRGLLAALHLQQVHAASVSQKLTA
ncbi:hypothetical protein KSP39_PZI014345 [Platanthera zijinensis]|uniref:adenylate kinase n=1 Tax=Platanthera zijinensis TaxID=2320716 RepID=A0AAP0BB36_9ASPA